MQRNKCVSRGRSKRGRGRKSAGWKRPGVRGLALVLFAAVLSLVGYRVLAAEKTQPELRQAAQKAQQAGNFKDAYEMFTKFLADPDDDPERGVGRPDQRRPVPAAARAGRRDRRLPREGHRRPRGELAAAGDGGPVPTRTTNHQGFIVAGKFYRGGRHGNDGKLGQRLRARPRPRPAAHAATPRSSGRRREGQGRGRRVLLPLRRHAARPPLRRRRLAAAVPDRPVQAAGLRGRVPLRLLRRRQRPRRAGRREGPAGLPPHAQELGGRQDRRRAVAVVPAAGVGVFAGGRAAGHASSSPASCTSSSTCRRWPAATASGRGSAAGRGVGGARRRRTGR